MEIIQSYKISLNNKTRLLTKSKQKIITDFAYKTKQLYNYISKTNSEGFNYWPGMTKSDNDFIRKHYEKEFQNEHFLKSGHAQNIYKNANKKYIDTIKSYNSTYSKKIRSNKNIKHKSIKPYFEDLVEFPLDDRMISSKALEKDDKLDNLYWLSISNPFKSEKYINKQGNRKKNILDDYENIDTFKNKMINIPLFFYPEIQELYDKGYKYSFAIHKDYIKIIFKYEISEIKLSKIDNDINSDKKYIDNLANGLSNNRIAIDFGKYISTYDGIKSNQYDLSKMYKKIHKIQFQINDTKSKIDNIKNDYQKNIQSKYNMDNGIENDNDNDNDNKNKRSINYGFTKLDNFKELIKDLKILHNRIKGIRKSAYGFIINDIQNNNIKDSNNNSNIGNNLDNLNSNIPDNNSKNSNNYNRNPLEIIIEDLSFEAIEKYQKNKEGNIMKDKIDGKRLRNPKYKGKKFNIILNIMGKGLWQQILSNKIKMVGNHLNIIDARYSSQECSLCHNVDKASRNGRIFKCHKCGHHLDADINAAMNLYSRSFKV